MQVQTKSRKVLVILTILVAISLSAVSIPGLDLANLVRSSDLIVAGKIMSVREQSKGVVEIYGKRFSSIRMLAMIHVNEVLKGKFNSPVLELTFDLPITPAGSIGYRGVEDGTYRVVLLKSSKDGYTFLSPYYPSFPATQDVVETKQNLLETVIAQITGVLKTPTTAEAEKLEAISTLHGINTQDVIATLTTASGEEDEIVKLAAVAELLNRNDISVLPTAIEALMHPTAGIPGYIRQNLAAAIGAGVANANAVPGLSKLLHAEVPEIRRNAASALRNTASRAAIPSLVKALSDSDFQVRYYGVIGLAEISGETEWRPLLEDFQENQDKYLVHWKDWAKNNRY